MEASHVGRFDDFDEFGEISSNCQMHANKLNTWRPAMLADLTIISCLSVVFWSLAKYPQIRHICQIRHIRRIRRFVGTLVLTSFACILAFCKILSNSSYLPNSSNSRLCWYRSLEFTCLNFGIWRNIVKFAIFVITRISGHIWRMARMEMDCTLKKLAIFFKFLL